MTEDEARASWCPMVRGSDGSRNKLLNRCIASACMMWRATGQTAGYCGLAGTPTGSWAGGGA